MSVTAPAGFTASGISAGIKESDESDLALVVAKGEAVASAGVFTSNKVQAAPVLISKNHLKAAKSQTKAVILNSGCANAATGEEGYKNALDICEKTAAELGVATQQILTCSTGLIGYQLPIEKVLGAVPELVQKLSDEGGADAARAIMTTDTKPKEHTEKGDEFIVGGMAKGAAMLAPNMATMLAVITTDATCSNPAKNLQKILQQAAMESFNKMTVDGVQSTNDTVILLASGEAGEKPITKLQEAVNATCQELAKQMAGDAEGATKTVKVHISGAPNKKAADHAARYIADSVLIKCSWHGGDPYWGRLASELGAAGLSIDLDKLSISYGGHKIFEKGSASNLAGGLAEYMSGSHLDIFVDLGLGTGEGHILTCDLGHGYIEENSTTS